MLDIAIVLNGEMKDEKSIAYLLSNAQYIIAIDGGLNHLKKLNIKPDLMIGDLDSVQAENLYLIEQWHIPCHKFPPEKDMTDSELALQYCMKLKFEPKQKPKIGLLAAFGSRIDHVLSNQFLAEKYAAQFDFLLSNGEQNQLILQNNTDMIKNVTFTDDYFRKFSSRAMVFTVLSLSDLTKDLSIRNAKYPLQNDTLSRGNSRGVSNEPILKNDFYQSKVKISFGKGCLSIFIVPEE